MAKLFKIVQERYKGPADDRRILPPNIVSGDKVLLLSNYTMSTRPIRRLAEPYLGSFEVTDHIGGNSIRLRFPYELRHVHPVFHVFHIEPSVPNRFPDRQPPPPEPIEINGELEYKPREILDSVGSESTPVVRMHKRCLLIGIWEGIYLLSLHRKT